MINRVGMMARVALLVGVVLSTAGAQYSCSSDGNGLITHRDIDSGDGPTFSTTLILRDSAGAETYRFDSTELITFELTVRNRTDRVVTLQMPSTARSEFLVFTEGGNTPRWRSNQDQVFPPVITELVFQANETRVFELDWTQETRDGTFLERGRYEARGVLAKVGFPANPLAPHELGSNLRVLTID
ncbi:MAG: BsuPI-related putative proteinase inhibitor [Pseudomonadota bacterium]